ncbi:hypothetical protein K469DRAFT_478602, partial [Zopfia rhizophila CBS 207.26]
MDIVTAFEVKNIPTVKIQAENVAADVEIFARSEVEKLRKGDHGKKLYIHSDELKERVVQTLIKKAEGMFLWVNLQLENLCQISKAQKDHLVQDALETLPQGLEGTYIRIVERIEAQPPYMRGLALNCLAWMVYARRPLSTRELQDALATNSDCRSRQGLQLDDVEVILEACGTLLEEANGAIRPIHYSVQEFFTNPAPESLQPVIRRQVLDSNSMHTRLSFMCLRYIQLSAFNEPTRNHIDLYFRLQYNPFVCYATQNFDHHISQCGTAGIDAMQQLEELFRQASQCLAAVLQIKVVRDGSGLDSVRRDFDPILFPVSASTIIYATQLYELHDLRRQWAGHTPPKYALHYASAAGLTSAVVRILEAECDINESDGRNATPLYYASAEAHLPIVRLLLEKGADVNTQGGYYGNALQAASYGGHDKIVDVLVKQGAVVNA